MSLQLVGTGADRVDITTNTTTRVKSAAAGGVGVSGSGPGRVAQIVVWNVGSGATIDVYDDPGNGTTNHCWSWATADGKGVFALQYPMKNGITVVTAGTGAPSLSVVYA